MSTRGMTLPSSVTERLMYLMIDNRKGIYNACAYVTRHIKAASRFVRRVDSRSETYAMYVRSCDQTWACVTCVSPEDGTVSTKLVVYEGCALDDLEEAHIVSVDLPVQQGLSREFDARQRVAPDMIRSLAKVLPTSIFEAAMAIDNSDAHFRRWREEGSEESKRVDAIYVPPVAQTWARVQDGNRVRFVALRGFHLDNLSYVFAGRETNAIVNVTEI